MQTAHGQVVTPIFMPVGTQASVKTLDSADLFGLEAQIILANTYHLYLRPGLERLEKAGGIHKFMRWSRPVLTDSGGFQVFSLGDQQRRQQKNNASLKPANIKSARLKPARVFDDRVEFVSHWDGSKHTLDPEKAIEIQRVIGADIIMAFDECVSDQASDQRLKAGVERTHRWAKRSLDFWHKHKKLSIYGDYQALFGIIQGSLDRKLRTLSAKTITKMGFDGIAVGGETVGYNMEGTGKIMQWIEPLLPADKPRYAMGLGRDPQDIIDAVRLGFDMFDCVGPTRLARNGSLYVGRLVGSTNPKTWRFASSYRRGRLSIGNRRYATDDRPLDQNCDCLTCQTGYSRAYLHHLYKARELSYYRLATLHNLSIMLKLSNQLRKLILE